MKLRTELQVKSFPFNVTHKEQLFFVGSCFSEHIAKRLSRLQYKANGTPFGVLFNPIAIIKCLEDSIELRPVEENELVSSHGIWHHWDLHGQFGRETKEGLISEVDQLRKSTHQQLKEAKVLFVTLGSAWVYKHNASGLDVGNCHKVPQQEFKKRMLSVVEITHRMRDLISRLHTFNPDLEVVLTVSPVKHLRDGLSENLLSKSTLLLATAELAQLRGVSYFPSYELITEDLRDYRFFESDMAHPNAQAIDYVWQKFSAAVFSEEQQRVNERLEKLLRMQEHRALFPGSEEAVKFQEKVVEEVEAVKRELGLEFGG